MRPFLIGRSGVTSLITGTEEMVGGNGPKRLVRSFGSCKTLRAYKGGRIVSLN